MYQEYTQISTGFIQKFVSTVQIQLFQNLKEAEFTGEFRLSNYRQEEWKFYFYMGRIFYAAGGVHPLRRFRRSLYFYSPQLLPDLFRQRENILQKKTITCWEHDLLLLYLENEDITREDLSKIIQYQLKEILFDITQTTQLKYTIIPKKLNISKMILIDVQRIIVETWKAWQEWQTAKIAERSPNLAPLIVQPEQLEKQASPKTYQALTKLLKDKHTLRDLAIKTGIDTLQLLRFLLPYIQMGLIELVNIPDLIDLSSQKEVDDENGNIPVFFRKPKQIHG